MDAPSVLEIVAVLAVGFAVVLSGIRSKWKYISRVEPSKVDDPWKNVTNPEIRVRVRRLAILYVICLLGMALALLIMLLSMSTIFSMVALIFAFTGASAHFLIDLDTSRR